MSQGEIVETGTTAEIFERPRHPYTRRLLAAEPTPPARCAADRGAVVLTAEGVKVWFPVKAGVLRRTVDYVKAVDGVSVTIQEGRTVGVVGESGSGKTTLGLALLRLLRSDGRIQFQGRELQGLGAGGPPAAPPRDADRLPGSLRLAVAAACPSSRSSGKGSAFTPSAGRAAEREALIDEALDRGRARAGDARPLSARAVGRAAAARRASPGRSC